MRSICLHRQMTGLLVDYIPETVKRAKLALSDIALHWLGGPVLQRRRTTTIPKRASGEIEAETCRFLLRHARPKVFWVLANKRLKRPFI